MNRAEERRTLAAFPFITPGPYRGRIMTRDLADLYKSYDEKILLDAIEIANRPVIVKYLRKLADNITPDIVNKLADYLDPDGKPIKCGPKPKKKRSWMFGNQVASHYYWLCENRELARLFLNHDKEAFFLVENSELFDAKGNFSPQWKYPLAKRTREVVKLPNKGQIQDLVCEIYKISSRTFDDLKAAYKK